MANGNGRDVISDSRGFKAFSNYPDFHTCTFYTRQVRIPKVTRKLIIEYSMNWLTRNGSDSKQYHCFVEPLRAKFFSSEVYKIYAGVKLPQSPVKLIGLHNLEH